MEKRLAIDSDEEDIPDDFESDLDEDEEEEEEINNAGKKRKRVLNPFIEEEAAVDDDDDEDEDEDDYDEEGPAELDEVAQKTFMDDARHREYDRRQREKEDMNAEQIAALMKDRYGKSHAQSFKGDLEHIPQRLLIPSVNDPKLWLAKCKQGKERDIVISLMRKCFDTENSDNPLQILSAFARESLNGYIYIEAEKQIHVQNAIDKLNGLYAQTLKLVPVNEMVDCLTIKKKDLDLKEGAWVRVKKGRKYNGDLAQILDILDNGEAVKIKIIPRIDYIKESRGEKRKKSSTVRPPAKLFSPDFVEDKRLLTSYRDGYWQYQNEMFDRDGYMEKEVKIASLAVQGVNPTLEEITTFSGSSATGSGKDLEALIEANLHSVEDFEIGENVEVIRGELANLEGSVMNVENGIVTIKPQGSYGLNKPLQFAAKLLRKRFKQGEHVKVINGVHADETGMILKISNSVAEILSDSTMTTFEVFIRDVRASTDVNAGAASAAGGRYDQFDLVQTSPTEVGVVTRIEKDTLVILNQHGQLCRTSISQIMKKLENKRAVSTDSAGSPVQANDLVQFIDPIKLDNKRGTVIHVYRTHIFVRSREVLENAGVVVLKNTSVSVLGGKKSVTAAPQFARPTAVAGRGRGRGRGGRDPLLHKTVTIIGGPYKGYIGIVKDVANETARVELHTSNKTINVDRAKISIPGAAGDGRDQSFASNRAQRGFDNRGRYGGDSGRTPAWNSGSKTPAWDSGSKTPAWDSGSKTPAWDSGSKTPAWDSGSKTPAWDSGSKTPAWDSGSKTPAWDSRAGSSSKPAWESQYSHILADTPGPASGDTPYNPNTPYNIPTTPYNPNTPAPQTPFNPTTPAYPATPGDVATPYVPATPFVEGATPQVYNNYSTAGSYNSKFFDNSQVVNWRSMDVEVIIGPSDNGTKFRSGAYDKDVGVIEHIESNTCKVYLTTHRDTVAVPNEFLKPVIPRKRDWVKVTGGEFTDKIGQLLTTDDVGLEGIVKIKGDEKGTRVIKLIYLAKYAKRE